MTSIKATLGRWAAALGTEPRTLGRKLSAAGIHLQPRQLISARMVFTAVVGDAGAERARKTKAESRLLELKLRQQQDELVPLAEAENLLRDVLFPIRQWVLALPASACSRCNPADPQLARDALQRIVDD